MTTKSEPEKYRAPALDKGLDILELLATQPSGMTRSEIVKSLERGPSEIYRMLERLVIRGYVNRSLEGDRFSLSIKLFQLGAAFPPVRRLVARAQPLMDRFAQASRQSVHLVVPDLGRSYVVAQASGRSAWEFRLRLGAELDLFKTGSGLTLLAFLPEDQRAHHLSLTPAAASALPKDTAEELAAIRAAGHRIQPSQQLVGVTDISVPVFAESDIAVGVLTCPFLPLVDRQEQGAEVQISQCLELLSQASAQILAT